MTVTLKSRRLLSLVTTLVRDYDEPFDACPGADIG